MSPPAIPSQAAPSSLPMGQAPVPLVAKERALRLPRAAATQELRHKDFLQRLREAGL